MNEEILRIMGKLLYENKIDDMYMNKKNINDLQFPLKIKREDFENIPFNVVSDFNDNYFEMYKNILYENALIYAIYNNDKEYINFINANKNNIKDFLSNNYLFRIKTTSNAIRNICNKVYSKSNNDENVKKMYPQYFELVNEYKFITDVVRDIILKMFFIAKNEGEMLAILDIIFFSCDLDHIIKSTCPFDIKIFKALLKHIIVGDNYLFFNNAIDSDSQEELSKEPILEYIEENIDKNKVSLPVNNDLRYDMYMSFIDYNLDNYSKKYDLVNLKNEECIKKLKKINPFIFLEGFNDK